MDRATAKAVVLVAHPMAPAIALLAVSGVASAADPKAAEVREVLGEQKVAASAELAVREEKKVAVREISRGVRRKECAHKQRAHRPVLLLFPLLTRAVVGRRLHPPRSLPAARAGSRMQSPLPPSRSLLRWSTGAWARLRLWPSSRFRGGRQ